MVSCESKIIKIVIGVFNLICLILGAGVCYIGVKLLSLNDNFNNATKLADIQLNTVSTIIMIIGIVIVLISFLGFFGAFCENAFMLNAYGFLMVLMVAGQIYVIVYSISHKSNLEEKIETGIKNAIKEIGNNTDTIIVLQELQYGLKCCGWDGPNDYSFDMTPVSCCDKDTFKKNATEMCGPHESVVFKDGCKQKLQFDEIGKYFSGTIGVGIAGILFELVLIFAACCLAREVRR